MNRKPPKTGPAKDGEAREARLKAALKANLARRKAQARARAVKPGDTSAGGDSKES